MARQPHGEGHIYKRGKDFYFQIRILNAEGQRVRKTFKGGKTRKEAARRLKEFKESRCISIDAQQTFGTWLINWIENYSDGKADSTVALYKSLMKNHVLPEIGSIKLSELRPLTFSSLYARLAKYLEAKTILTINSMLNAAIKQAIRDEVIFRNVLHSVAKPKAKKSKHRILSKNELKAFFEKCLKSEYKLNFILMLFGGLRRGEALGMKWSSVNIDRAEVTVKQQLTENRSESGPSIKIGPLKTERSYRIVKLPAEVMQHFAQVPKSHRHGFIYQGKIKSPRRFVAEFKRLMSELGITDMRPHCLRHTHASHLLANGVPLPMVTERIGHCSIKVTGDIYSHAVPGAQDAAVLALDKIFEEIRQNDEL
ncbi:MAG: tyrosine-type recombinase/integrase [Candidatus Riflebacteria bacterium]